MLRYGETFDDVPLVVNVAGRFDTKETPRSRFTEEQWDALETTGSFLWNVKVCVGVPRVRRFTGGGGRQCGCLIFVWFAALCFPSPPTPAAFLATIVSLGKPPLRMHATDLDPGRLIQGKDLTINSRDFEERAALDMKRTAEAIK